MENMNKEGISPQQMGEGNDLHGNEAINDDLSLKLDEIVNQPKSIKNALDENLTGKKDKEGLLKPNSVDFSKVLETVEENGRSKVEEIKYKNIVHVPVGKVEFKLPTKTYVLNEDAIKPDLGNSKENETVVNESAEFENRQRKNGLLKLVGMLAAAPFTGVIQNMPDASTAGKMPRQKEQGKGWPKWAVKTVSWLAALLAVGGATYAAVSSNENSNGENKKIEAPAPSGDDKGQLPPNVTIEPSASPSEEVSPSPSVSASPSPDGPPRPSATESEKTYEEIVNQQIKEFIDKTGNFSDEAIQQYLINYHGNKNLELGFVESSEGIIFLQGFLFDYTRVGDYIVMAVGFDGADGKNHVKPAVIPIKMYERPNNEISFTFEKLGDWKVAGTSHDLIYKTNAKDITDTLDLLKGHAVKLGFPNPDTESSGADKKQLIDLFGEEGLPLFENAQEKTIELASEVTFNESIITDVNKITYSSNADFEIPDIDSLDDLKNVDLSKVPWVSMIGSNLIP